MKERCKLILLIVPILILFVSAFALAEEDKPNILFIFDSSGSMMNPLGDAQSKIEVAKKVLSGLVGDHLAGANVGLMAYGHREKTGCDDIETLVPIGKLDANVIKQKISSLDAKGNTPIAAALDKGANEIQGLKGKSTIVLISDGEETCGGDPIRAAEIIRKRMGINVIIQVIGFDVDDKAKQQLAGIAQAGGGEYYAAKDAEQLKQSLVEIKEKAVEPARELFTEEFSDPFLSEAWEVVNDDPNGRVLDEGKFFVSTSSGDIHKETVNNILLCQKEVPTKKYTVTTEFSTSLLTEYGYHVGDDFLYDGQVSGLTFYTDKDNYIVFAVGRARSSWVQAILWKRQGGKRDVTIYLDLKELKNPDTYLLKIERRKFKYTAYWYNPDPEKGGWQRVGTISMMGKKLRPGLVAYRGRVAAEVITEFDSFKITELKE